MNALATLYSPSLDPIGPESLTALVIASAFAAATAKLIPSQNVRLTAMRVGPIVLLVMSLFEEGSVTSRLLGAYRNYPGASDYIAGYVCYTFGYVLGLNLLTEGGNQDGLLGLILSALHGGSVVASGARPLEMHSLEYAYEWIAFLVFVICWCGGVMVWQSRRNGLPLSRGTPASASSR